MWNVGRCGPLSRALSLADSQIPCKDATVGTGLKLLGKPGSFLTLELPKFQSLVIGI